MATYNWQQQDWPQFATRDLQQLLEIGAFVLASNAGGRSTSYLLAI